MNGQVYTNNNEDSSMIAQLKSTGILTIDGNMMLRDFFTDFDANYNEIPLKKIAYYCKPDTFVVDSMIYGVQAVSPYPADRDQGTLKFKMKNSRFSVTRVDRSYDISIVGSLELQSGIHVKTSLIHKANLDGYLDEYNITGSGPVHINIGEVNNMVYDFTGSRLPPAFAEKDLTVDTLALSGIREEDEYTWLSVKLLGDNARIAMVFHEKFNAGHKLKWRGFASEFFCDINFAYLYPTLKISHVPYFGTATAKDVAFINIPMQDEFCDIPNGMFDDVLLFKPECIKDTDIKAAFDVSIIPFTFKDSDDGNYLLSYPVNTAMTLREVLKMYAPGLNLDDMNKRHMFFFDIRTVYNVGVDRITLPLQAGEDYIVCVDLIDNKKMSFFFNLLVITRADIKFCLTEEKNLDVSLEGDMAINSVHFTATVNKTDDEYTIFASAKEFNIVDAISHFHAQFFPRELREAFNASKFLNFQVLEPFLKYQFSFGSPDQFLEMGGSPSFFGYDGVEMDAILVHHNSTSDLAVGIFIVNVSLETLLRDIALVDIKGIPMLEQQLNASILISPTAIEDHELQDHSILKGITMEADMGFPEDCSSDNFCSTIQRILGADACFTLRGTVESADSFSVFAGLGDVDLTHGYKLENAGLEIAVGEETRIGITGSLHIPTPNITLSGKIEVTLSGEVEVQLAMSGCWNKVFNQDWLSICNIEGSIGISSEALLPSELGIGGEIKLGSKTCSTPFVAKGYVGVDAQDPDNDYYYVQFTKATISSLLKAFCWKVNLPSALKETGFPNGLLSSFSLDEKKLPNLTIPAGFHFQGTLDILGLRGYADIDVQFEGSELLHMDVELPPISIANGLLEMYRSSDDHLNGPFLKANISLDPPTVDVAASGYVYVLGASEEASLRITDESYEFSFKAKVLNLFVAYFEISAFYKSPLSDASFEIKGYFENDLMEAIEKLIQNALDAAVKDARKKIDAAEKDLESKKKILEDAKGTLEQDKGKVDDAYGAFHAADDALDAAERKIRSVLSRCRKFGI